MGMFGVGLVMVPRSWYMLVNQMREAMARSAIRSMPLGICEFGLPARSITLACAMNFLTGIAYLSVRASARWMAAWSGSQDSAISESARRSKNMSEISCQRNRGTRQLVSASQCSLLKPCCKDRDVLFVAFVASNEMVQASRHGCLCSSTALEDMALDRSGQYAEVTIALLSDRMLLEVLWE